MNVIYLDTETTGLDPKTAQIVELGLVYSFNDAVSDEVPEAFRGVASAWRCRPSGEIPEAATAIHGISDADVAHVGTFAEHHAAMMRALECAEVIVGYNLEYDLQVITNECARASLPDLIPRAALILDVFKLWKVLEPRRLQDAHQRFVGVPLDGAHSAVVDAMAVRSVLQGMRKQHSLQDDAWRVLATLADPQRALFFGPTAHIQWKEGLLCLTFGKHAGKSLTILATVERSYLRWIVENDSFPNHVQDACRRAMVLSATEFMAWARK